MNNNKKIALIEVAISRCDWKVCVGHDTSYKCSIPFDICKQLLEFYENDDEDGLLELKDKYPAFFDEDDNLDDFQCILERHIIGDQTDTYSEDEEDITYEEYSKILERGLNHECASMSVTDLNSEDSTYIELYAG